MKFMSDLFKSTVRSAQKGFSLLEIIIVMAIIGMLMGIVVTRIAGTRENANVSLTGTRAAGLYTKIIQYQLMNNNQYPPNLAVMMTGASPLISADESKDAWGNDFCYTAPTTQSGDVFIGSKGKDGKTLTYCYKNGKQQINTASGGGDNSLDGCSC